MDGCVMGGALEGFLKKAKGLRSKIASNTNSHRDVKYSIGNIV